MPPTTVHSHQQPVDSAKAPLIAFNDKNWNAVRAGVTADVLYDEVATNRKAQGVDEVIRLWQGWAMAFPDAKAEIHSAIPADGTVVVEVTWRGTHKGPLPTPEGALAPTGKRIEVRACFVVELAGDKVERERHYFDMATLMHQLRVS
jgi:steroid delta-isomerase-like uncharacterized protein